jgi:hypothetical protein
LPIVVENKDLTATNRNNLSPRKQLILRTILVLPFNTLFLQLTVSTEATKLFVSSMWCEDELHATAAAAYIILSKKKKQRRKHKVWMRPSLQERNKYGVLRLKNSSNKDDLLSGHIIDEGEGKAVPLQAWTGPEGSRRLRLPDF